MSLTVDMPPAEEHRDLRVIREFAEFLSPLSGYFVDVGANHPFDGSQSWQLERRGWSGVLVEPQPDLAAQLRNARRASVFAVACSSPQNAGRTLPFHVAGMYGVLSSLNRDRMSAGAQPHDVINVPIRTLDSILEEAAAPKRIDFLSIDVEGHEIEVLGGFTFSRWKPRFVLLEDFVGDLRQLRFMKANGYRLVRRVDMNSWYVPEDAPICFGLIEKARLLRKYYLALPIRKARNYSRRLRGKITC